MKKIKPRLFANYYHVGKHYNSIGDQIQIITVDFLYSQMGINKKDIVYIDTKNLQTYDGEQVWMPVSMPLLNYKEHGIAGMFSNKITPIFFGLTMVKDTLLPEEVDYLKLHEPIGCRDERTYGTMLKYGINVYLGGCLTVALPKRKQDSEKQKKVFIIDPTEGIKNYIPAEIAKNALWVSHDFYNCTEDPINTAEKRYQQYFDQASLVITSLLHASMPCMAAGIPIVLAKDLVSYRFGWVESLLRIYTPNEYADINWNPFSIEYESHKELVRTIFKKRMNGEGFSEGINKIHDFYMNRKRNEYIIDYFIQIKEFLDNTWLDHEKAYKYAVWGLTQITDITVNYITKHYPNAQLVNVYDLQTDLSMNGISAKVPEEIINFPDETIFVTTTNATESAKRLFRKINKPTHLYKIIEIIF